MPSASSWKTVSGVTPVWTFVGWCSVPWGIRCSFYIGGMRLCVCIMTCVPVCLFLLLHHSPHRRHLWKHLEVSGVTDCSLCVCAQGKSHHKAKIVCSNSLIAVMYLLLMCRNIIYHSDIVNSVFSDIFLLLNALWSFLFLWNLWSLLENNNNPDIPGLSLTCISSHFHSCFLSKVNFFLLPLSTLFSTEHPVRVSFLTSVTSCISLSVGRPSPSENSLGMRCWWTGLPHAPSETTHFLYFHRLHCPRPWLWVLVTILPLGITCWHG